MASIVIASKANSLYLAECEVLAEFLSKNLDFKYTVVKKHKDDWEDFLTSLVESYGFTRKCCPIVFTVEGQLIGDVTDFYDYSQNKYGKVYRVGKDTLDLRAVANAKAINSKVKRKIKGPNIIEKIQKALRKSKKKKIVKNLEGYFKPVVKDGIPYRVRLTDMSQRSVEFTEEIEPEVQEEEQQPEPEVESDKEENQEGEGESPEKEQVEEKQEAEGEGKEDQPKEDGEGEGEKIEAEGEGETEDQDKPLEEYDEEVQDEEIQEETEEKSVEILSQFPFDKSKGMSFEDFEKFYKDEIEGKLNRREAIREKEQQNEEEEEEKDEEENLVEEIQPDEEAEGEGQEGEGDKEAKERAAAEKARIEALKVEEERKRMEEEREMERQQKDKEREEFYDQYVKRRYGIDEKHHMGILEKLQVITFDHNYALSVHPEPPMQDVLMLFQYNPELMEDDITNYEDFGLAERLPLTKIPEDMENYVEDEESKIKVPRSPLRSTEINIAMPLSALEWKLWYDLIVATKGHGFIQILPVGYRSHQAFSANLLQIAPKKAKDWGSFQSPLDKMISIREEYYKKENKRLFDENQKKKDSKSKDPANEVEKKEQEEQQKEEDAKNDHIYKFSKQNIFKLPEFDFPHCVCVLDSKPSDNSLVTDYIKISDELDLENLQNLGVTIILNEKYMFVSLLSQPYMKMENGLDLFLDPFSYGGIMNIHTKEHSWPQTAGIDVEDRIKPFLPDKKYSEPLPTQLPEPEPAVEEYEVVGENDTEGEGKEQEEEGEGEKEN